MKIKLTSLTVAVFLFSGGVFAQPNSTYGYIPHQASSLVSSLYELSRFNNSMGTARTAAMGGAFTSLGADLSSMNINPAGLGMYRRTSEIGITSSVFVNGTKNKWDNLSWTGTRTNAALNNIGFVINGYEGSGALTSLTVGVGYNRLADFNFRSTADIGAEPDVIGISKMFALQLQELSSADLANPWDNFDIPYSEWGAHLGYKTGLLRPVAGKTNIYDAPGIAADAATAQFANTVSRGSVGEYSFSMGMNFRNKLYFGFTFGMIDIYQKRSVNYSETYYDNNPGTDVDPVNYMSYTQQTLITGSGFNMKLGAVYRPVPELRIGVAVHSPTFVNIETQYDSDMYVESGGGPFSSRPLTTNSAWSPTQRITDKYITPTRLLTGVSYAVAGLGLIAVDYECAWYNGIRLWGNDYHPSDIEYIKEDVKKLLAPDHTVRAGGEFMALSNLALRAGYAYSRGGFSKAVRDGMERPNIPMEKNSNTVSFGLGYRFGSGASLDLTYVYTGIKYTNYDMFWYENPYGLFNESNPEIVALYRFDLDRTRHSIMLSFNMRF